MYNVQLSWYPFSNGEQFWLCKTDISCITTCCSQVAALKEHQKTIGEHQDDAEAWSSTPTTTFDLAKFEAWLAAEKVWFEPLFRDCRDAKRRVTLQKGPKPKAKAAPNPGRSESDSEDEVSEGHTPTTS